MSETRKIAAILLAEIVGYSPLLVDHRRAGIASVGDSRERTPRAVTSSSGRLQIGIGGRIASEFARITPTSETMR